MKLPAPPLGSAGGGAGILHPRAATDHERLVLIRTFLSFSLELEATGRWPWQRSETAARQPEH